MKKYTSEKKNPGKAEASAVSKLKQSWTSNSDTIHYYYMKKEEGKVETLAGPVTLIRLEVRRRSGSV